MKINKKVTTYIGIILSIIILGFMLSELIKNFSDIKIYLKSIDVSIFILSIIIYSCAFLITGYNWAYILSKLDPCQSIIEYMHIHVIASLSRYIPGGFWNILGKGYLCSKSKVNKTATTVSIILEYVFLLISSGLFIFIYGIVFINNKKFANYNIIAIGVIILIIVMPFGVRLGSKMVSKLLKMECTTKPLSNKYIYLVFFEYVLSWIVTGIGLVVLVKSFEELEFIQEIYLVLSYPISWVIGFVSPSPNGMGVREGILKILLGDAFDYNLIILMVLVTRIWTILGEILAFIVFELIYYLINKNSRLENNNMDIKSKALFITTKNLDYLRNVEEIELLKKNNYEVHIIGSNSKKYLTRLIYVYWNIFKLSVKQFDVIFIGFSPQLILPIWKWKFRKKKIAIDFFISVYDTFVDDRKKFKPESIIAKFMKRIDKFTINSADYVISDTYEHGKFFIDEFGLDKNKLKVVYLEADKKIYNPDKVDALRPKKYENKYIVLYFGSVLPLQGVDIVINAARLLKHNRNIHFIIIGPVNDEDKFACNSIEYINWLNQEKLAQYISYSDLCLAGHFNNEIGKAKRSVPGKAFIYRAMGKPMILGENFANRELYNEKMNGIYYVNMGSAVDLSKKIEEIYNKEFK